MKIKLSHILGAGLLCGVFYISNTVIDSKLRNMAFESQVEPSFYQRQIINELKNENSISAPKGSFDYSYYYEPNSLIKTVWTINKKKLKVDGYLVTDVYASIEATKPTYTVTANVKMKGRVLIFENLRGDKGLLPKYGLAIKNITNEHVQLETSDGRDLFMYKRMTR